MASAVSASITHAQSGEQGDDKWHREAAERLIEKKAREASGSETHPFSGLWQYNANCRSTMGWAIAPAEGKDYFFAYCGTPGCFPPSDWFKKKPESFTVYDEDTIGVALADNDPKPNFKLFRCSGFRKAR